VLHPLVNGPLLATVSERIVEAHIKATSIGRNILVLEDIVGRILAQLELDTRVEVGDNDVVHARVWRALERAISEAEVVAQQDVADNHLHRVVGEEAAGTDDLAVAEVQVIFARSCEL